MRVLALDCSAKSVSAAIAEDGGLISEAFLNIRLTHSETLLPLCEQVLTNARLTLNDIDALAVTAGPGSFTGVRIGISAVKGMCFAAKKPVYAFSSLEAMALHYADGSGMNGLLCGLMDARREQFYNAIFEIKSGKVIRICDDRIITASELKAEFSTKFDGASPILAGDGAALFWQLSGKSHNFALAPPSGIIQRAAGIAICASGSNCHVTPISPDALQPIYLRKSQAERERESKISN